MGISGCFEGCALALLRGDELLVEWVNDEFRQLLEPSAEPTGRRLKDVAPLSFASRGSQLRAVRRDGRVRTGQDRLFSVENGITINRWAAYRPLPDYVLVSVFAVKS